MDWMDLKAATGDPSHGAARPGHAPIPGLLDGLNAAQREACEHEEGPLLILAGPGSGKTRVITHRIVHLVTTGRAAPHEILAITFTNKAAREMRERVEKLLPDAKGLWISTFHSFCARVLRRDAEALEGYTRDFSIYDTSDRNQLLKKIVKDLGFDPKRFRPAAIGGWISTVKNTSVSEDGGLTLGGAGLEDEVYERVRRAYEKAMRESNALDFDDLLLKVLELFEKHPGVRDGYARRFRYVMADEYQDTNRVQYLLTRHLASHHGNLAVCGDPDQSIYAWRGADIANILDFERDFAAARVVRLEQNYRSKGNILAAASAVIAHNGARKAKELWSEHEPGEQLVLTDCGDENEEAREIALQILGLVGRGVSASEIAVFYRANFMQRALETALRLAQVPYQVVAGLEFYMRREIRDLVAYLRLLVNPSDDVAFRRVVNVPSRGVGATSMGRLDEWAAERGVSLYEAVRSEGALATIRGRARKSLAEFAALLERLAPAREHGAALALDLVLEEIDRDRWLAELDDGTGLVDRATNVDELRAHAVEYDRAYALGLAIGPGGQAAQPGEAAQPGRPGQRGGLRGFLEEIALVSEADGLDDEVDKVALMTLHACKGLEFDHVFIAGVEEELLPHARALADADDPDSALEEERRLFYVGMTRARERLFLSLARTRLLFGETRWSTPSRFLDEIPPELIEGAETDEEATLALGEYEPSDDVPKLAEGQLVRHDHFGTGRVVRLSGSGVNARAVVDFTVNGTRELLLTYAKLQPIEA